MVQKPGSSFAALIAASKAMPVTMPGNAIGNTSTNVIVSLPQKRERDIANAVSEPSTIAKMVASAATLNESRMADQISLRANAATNQCNVTPGKGNAYVRSSVVNAYKMMTSTGTCMNAS